MRKVVLYIAMSLDGYIADSHGGVEWLKGQGNDEENIDTYSEFVENIDTVLMGWNTYHQIVTELSPTEWVYRDLTSYVFTHNKDCSTKQICFTNENPIDLLKTLKPQNGKDIWICGGANLIGQLMCENIIDRYYISVMPVLLGRGIRLFGEFPNQQELRLVKTQSYNGIVELIYECK
ncbi:MAG: dihydrofolate reductase [Lachnospiraceae bacterium]|nr:dihydrofolate reductase [Lachnospiraceae bacterium]